MLVEVELSEALEAAVAPVSAVEVLAEVAGAEVALLPPLKSVAYQPEPLSWKPAAVSCLLKLAWPQFGQSVSTGSESFCNTSLANPQDAHL